MARGLLQNTFLTLSFLVVFVRLILKVGIIKASVIECGTTGDLEIPLIIGGQKTVRGEWPFVAALFLVKMSAFFCGGTLISANHVLTAAHCVKLKHYNVTLLPADIAVLLGAYDLTPRNETPDGQLQRNVIEIQIHPDWKVDSDKYDADISILVLSEKVLFTKFIRPVCMPADDTVIDDAMGYIVGWGYTENGFTPHIEFPKRAIIMSLNHSYCYTTDDATALISTQRTFCGRGEEQSPSSGDSGGGLFVLASAWVQYGIISAILPNKTGLVDANSITIYTNIKSFKSWIVETVRQSGGAVMTVNESKNLKINLNCYYAVSLEGTYGCWLYDLDIRSKNVEVVSFSGIHDYKKTNEDVKHIQFTNGTMFFLPNGVGNFFKNLNRLDVGRRSSSPLGTKLIRRSNLEKSQNLVMFGIVKNDIDTLDEYTLWDLSYLEVFELSNNSLKVIDEKTFEKNTKLKQVYLTSNQLEFLPRNLFENNLLLERVSLTNNKIIEIHEKMFEKNTKLKQLYLFSNQLKFLPSNLFQNNLLLEVASFYHNKIKELHEETFEKNVKLTEVNFHHNKLKEIDERIFEKNINLRLVFLHSNQLEFLPSNLFQNNLLLELVSLHHNKLNEIDEKTFEKNRNLRFVDFDSNQLDFLPRNLFGNNLLLEEVNFADNKIKVIDEKTFEENTKLRKVYIGSNPLEFLPRNLFQNNLLLEEVTFFGCSLKFIDINFAEFKNIRKIVLSLNVCIDLYYDGTNDTKEYRNEIRDLAEFQTLINEKCSSANP